MAYISLKYLAMVYPTTTAYLAIPFTALSNSANTRDVSNLTTVATPTISPSQPFSFSVSNSGDKSVVAGSSVTNSISTTLTSGSSQAVSFAVSGLPSGATGFFSSASCNPACSTLLNISTSGATPAGNFPITISAIGGDVTKATAFTLSVTLALTATPAPTTPSSSTGRVYYVAKTGNDSNSCAQAQSQSMPKLTINGGLSCLSGGDTLLIRGGTYAESIDGFHGSNLPSGSPGALTTLAAYPRDCSRGTQCGPGPSWERVMIRPSSGQVPLAIYPTPGDPKRYIAFDGLILDAINVPDSAGCAAHSILLNGTAFPDHLTFIN